MTVDATGGGEFENMSVPALMGLYYGRLFPHQEMFKWLAYGNDSKHSQADSGYFQRREFCFTLDGDIFVRYQSFKDCQEMQAAIKERCPSKIDIGPVYNVDPQRRSAYTGSGSGFHPVERELVFDIDLTDYDDVRTCGKEGHICSKCWPLMAAAIKILDIGLREDFGFEHILFVYSGRRGVHCWVCDERARRLTDEQRSAIASYFSVYKGQEKGQAKLGLGLEEHPAILRAAETLEQVFEERILPEQELLSGEGAHCGAVLGYIPDEGGAAGLRGEIQQRWERERCAPGEEEGAMRWRVLKEEVHARMARLGRGSSAKSEARTIKALGRALREVVFAYTYPRLDMEVSKKMNHLLKAPFCVHPKTGKVCVPIDPEAAWEFDPGAVPSVGALLGQLNTRKGEDWQCTEMAEAVGTFRRCFLEGLQAETKASLAAKAREAAAAPTLAW